MSRMSRSFREMLCVAALAVLATGCAPSDESAEEDQAAARPAVDTAGAEGDAYVRPSMESGDLTAGDTIPGHPSWTEQDWQVLRETVRWARDNRVDTLPMGERLGTIGKQFVGTPYVPQTLDPPGPEQLVINLRALDCVTFVENVLALAHFLERAPRGILEDRDRALDLYSDILTSIRYRGGELDGYTSRLHYFSEWMFDNADKGYVELVTQELGGVADEEPITFMTEHKDAYRQLTGLENFDRIAEIEERLSERPRYYIPQDRVKSVQDGIQTGDIIAATSTLEGLDVAHTGFALWQDGVLHLMHAPLVGEDVQISETPLADRLIGISKQDGIMVARPLPVGSSRVANR